MLVVLSKNNISLDAVIKSTVSAILTSTKFLLFCLKTSRCSHFSLPCFGIQVYQLSTGAYPRDINVPG
ncbi:MAG TPA: hypothetical protein VFK73_00335 [Paludibacter sp.]|nr:hypothetical protein [Paludibacter sp.]